MAGKRQFDEAEVLQKTLNLFWEKGYQATSMIDLATATGVQRGSLYNAYGNKKALFIKAFAYYSVPLLTHIEQSLSTPDLKTALSQYFESLIDRITDNSNSKGCFSTKAIMENSKKDDYITQKLQALLSEIESLIKNRLDIAVNGGELRGDSQEIAAYLLALSRGLAVLERVHYDKSKMKGIYKTALQLLQVNETHN